MKNRRAVIACGIFAAACLWLTGCGEEQDAKGVFSLNPATLEIEAGDSFDLTPEYQNFDGLDESALMVKWSSSAPAVAAVSEGTVIGGRSRDHRFGRHCRRRLSRFVCRDGFRGKRRGQV